MQRYRLQQLIVPCEFSVIETYYIKEYGLCKVSSNGKNGIYSVTENRLIVPCIYDNFVGFGFTYEKPKFFNVIRDGKMGICDYNGDEVVPCKYTYALQITGWTSLLMMLYLKDSGIIRK